MKINEKMENMFFEVLQSEHIDITDTCIKLVCQVRQSLKIDTFNHVKVDLIEDEKFNGKLSVNDYNLVLNFYIGSVKDDMSIPNKTETAKFFNTSESTIMRINKKLKDENKIYREGNNIYLSRGV